jgi:cell shape-determining protein MreC
MLVLFNKTDYFLIYKIKSTGIDIISPISNIISYPFRATFNTINNVNDLRLSNEENIKLKEEYDKSKNEIKSLEQTLKENNSRINVSSSSISFLEKDLELAKNNNGI